MLSARISEPTTGEPQLSFTQLDALETLPKEIERLEFEIGKWKKELAAPNLYTKEPKKFDQWVKALGKREKAVAAKEEQWLVLEGMREG